MYVLIRKLFAFIIPGLVLAPSTVFLATRNSNMGCSQSKANDVVVAAKPTEFTSTPQTVEQSSTVVLPAQQQISNNAPINVQATQNATQSENKQTTSSTLAPSVNKEVKTSPKTDVKESTPATMHSNINNSAAKVETQNSSLVSPQQTSSSVDSSQFTERLIAITPHVGFVIKTKRLDTNEKVFINVLFHGAVTGSVPGDAQSSVDKKGEKCVAYSVIVPANIYQVSKTHESPEMNHVSLHAIDLINATYDVSLDREFKLPKMKRGFVGDAVEEVYITVLDKVTPPPTPVTPVVAPPSAPAAVQNPPSIVAPVEKKEPTPAKEEPKAVPTPQPVEPTPVVAPVAAPKEEEPTVSYDVTFTENNTHQFTEEEDSLQLIPQVARPVPPKMHGWLKKRGHIVLNWKSRYFVLDNGYLTYYVDKLDCPPFGKDMKGQLCLAGYREKEITETSTAAAAGRRTSSTANGGVDAVLWLNRIHLVYDPSLITTQDAPGPKGKGTGEDEEYQDLLLEASNSDEKHAWLAAIQAHTEYFESTLSLVSPLLHVVQSSTSLAEEDVAAEDGEGGQKAAKRGSTLSVSPNQRSMSKAASRHNSTYSVLDDKKRWCIFLQTGEELVMTGLTGKPNPVGIHLIRQLVLTSRKRLIYIDTKTMEVKGEVQWSSNPTAAYPSAKKIDETTFEIHESAKKVYRFIVKDTCTAAQWVTAISNVEAPSSNTGK